MEEQKPRMTLAAVQSGRQREPLRITLYGTEGIGKSSFAASAPAPIFLDAEKGTLELDVRRFPQPQSWDEVLDAVTELQHGEHQYQTLVIDTLDAIEPLCWSKVCELPDPKTRKKRDHIEDFGFAKGYEYALDKWRQLAAALDRLRAARGMSVILLSHAQVKTFKSPDTDDYDRYQMAIHHKASGLLRGWSDIVLFARLETFTHDSNGRAKGVSSGARVLHTQACAAWDAKNRHNLPETLPLSYAEFEAGLKAGEPEAADKLLARIDALLEAADTDLAAKVRETVDKAGGNAAMLAKIANRLQARVNIARENA